MGLPAKYLRITSKIILGSMLLVSATALGYHLGFGDGYVMGELDTVQHFADVCTGDHLLGNGYWCGYVKRL